ncbi:MAG TPA: hypothetical protein DCX22_02140 [Dehalococcoidia bacterium]|nr:hypothetical protein [Dehalococcoidia bacterium]
MDSLGEISNLAICYSTTREEALALAERVRSRISLTTIRIARLRPTLAGHTVPGVLIAAIETAGDRQNLNPSYCSPQEFDRRCKFGV